MSNNPSIGTVPCPIASCGKTCQVKKFANRTTRDSGKRKAGRLYFDCPEHGRFGFDGKPAMQDYILENGKLDGAELPAEPPPAPPPPPAPAKPASAPPAAQPKKPGGWGFFND